MLVHVFRCKRGTLSWNFQRMCDWMYSRSNFWVFDLMFVFRVKSNCFHHTKVTIIYAICWLPPYHGYPELKRVCCAIFPTYKLDLATFANHRGRGGGGGPRFILNPIFTPKYRKYDFPTFSVILRRSLARVNS